VVGRERANSLRRVGEYRRGDRVDEGIPLSQEGRRGQSGRKGRWTLTRLNAEIWGGGVGVRDEEERAVVVAGPVRLVRKTKRHFTGNLQKDGGDRNKQQQNKNTQPNLGEESTTEHAKRVSGN